MIHSMYRSNELVNCRLLGGARPAEQAVQRNERGAGAGDAPVVPSAGVGANISAVRSSGLRGANTTMVFAQPNGAQTPGTKNITNCNKILMIYCLGINMGFVGNLGIQACH
jgi:hypothetical protein